METRSKVFLGIFVVAAVLIASHLNIYCNDLPRTTRGEQLEFTLWQKAVCLGQIKTRDSKLMVEVCFPQPVPPTIDEIIAGKEKAYRGDIDAQHNLAKLYSEGTAMPPDYKEAYYWFSLMAKTDATGKREAIAHWKTAAAARLTAEEKTAVDATVSAWQPAQSQPTQP